MAIYYLADGGPNTTPTWHTDGAPGITTATLLLFAVSGRVTGIRYYAGDTQQVTVGFWQGATTDPVDLGVQLASATHTPSSTGWHVAPITPVDVEPGIPYIASRWHPNSYAFVGGFFNSSHGQLNAGDPVYGPATNQNISGLLGVEYQTGWASAAINGRFSIASSPGWPGTSGAGTYYGVDAEFTADADATTGTIDGVLPLITSSINGTIVDSGSFAGVLPVVGGQITGHTINTGTLSGNLPAIIGVFRSFIDVEPGALVAGSVAHSTLKAGSQQSAVLTASAQLSRLVASGRP